jgi:hypothetical protein
MKRAAGRQRRKPLLHLPDKIGSVPTKQRSEPQVETVPPVSVANEVKNREAILPLCPSKASTQLLQEDESAFGWA